MHFRSHKLELIGGLIATLFLCLIGWSISQMWLMSNSILIKDSPTNTSVTYSYFLTKDNLLPQSVLTQEFTATRLNKVPSRLGIAHQWFQLSINNEISQAQDITIMLDNPLADEINIYQITDQGEILFLMELGDKTNLVPRPQRVLPHIDLPLPPNVTTHLLIHFLSEGSALAPIKIVTQSDFSNYITTVHLIWSGFIGIVMLMTTYNLVLYIGLKDKAYLSYIGYLLSMLVLLGATHGFGYYLFPESIQRWISHYNMPLTAIPAYFAITFAVNFLRFSKLHGLAYFIAKTARIVMLIFIPLSFTLLEHQAAFIFLILQIFCYFSIFFMISKRLTAEYSWSRFYIISWVPISIGAGASYCLFVGLVDYNFITRHLFISTVIFEMAFISMALASRMSEIDRRRIYLATHDQSSDLPNDSMLEDAITRHCDNKNREPLFLFAAEITNYDLVSPYLTNTEMRELVGALTESFYLSLKERFTIIKIDAEPGYIGNSAIIQGRTLALLLSGSDIFSIKSCLNQLSDVDNFNPLQKTIPYRINCAFGIASCADSSNHHDIIRNAKRAISTALALDEPYNVYDPSYSSTSKRKIKLAQDLGHAIIEGSLELYHQPQICLEHNEAKMSEVLLRWHHPIMGFISPNEIIEIAEDTGLIKRLTLWVIEQTFIQATILLTRNLKPYEFSINISANDLSRPSFHEEVLTLIKGYDLNASSFTLEVTETTNLKSEEAFKSNLKKLAEGGFNLALDDFGTGYSSLTYANEHPFSELKIDRSFITEMLNSSKKMAIVTATISMAQELGLTVTAEGVEDEQTYHCLKTMNCDKAQGYLIEKPMPFDSYLSWVFDTAELTNIIGTTLPINFDLKPLS